MPPLWNSIQKDFGEHTPLSTHDDDEEEPPLPPYSDNPMTPTLSSRSSSPYSDNPSPPNGNGSNGAAVRRTHGRTNGSSSSSSAHKAVTVQEDEYYEDDEDQGFGEGDFFSSGRRDNNNNYSSTPSKYKRHNTPRYRTGLVCAYLQYIVTCCGACSFWGAGRARRIFMCLFYTILFVTIMVCASSIGYIIARDGSPFAPDATTVIDDVTSSSTGTTDGVAIVNSGGKTFDNQKTTATTTNKLPPPPSNLHDICTDYITTSGRQKCEQECSMAECCHFPATNKDHCWEDQAEDCATYRAACMGLELSNSNSGSSSGGTSGSGGGTTLDVVTILDAPPSNLHIACSSSSLETPEGFDMCAGLCRPSRCCYPDKFGCKVADDRYCDDYEDLCANVAESWRGSGHAVAPSSGTSSSSSSTTASQTTSIANEVMQACNAANLNPPYQCMEACKKGACCYVSSQYPPIEMLYDHYDGPENNPLRKVNNCASNNGFCQQYGSCEHLNHMKDVAGWNSDEVQYVLDVSTPCKAEHIAQFGALECSNLCQPAHCCFSGEYECDDVQLGHLNCDDYEACQVLYPSKKGTTKDLLKLAESIDEVCAAASLQTIGGRSECQNLCNDHLCCFYQDGCTNDPDKNCLAYAGCEAYYKLPTDGGAQVNANNNIDAGSSAGTSLGIDELVTALEDACSEESLKTINGIYECHNKCQAHLCCFTADSKVAQQDCSSERPVACSAYEPCKRLVTPTQGAQSVKSLEPDDIQKIVFDACFFGNDPLKITDQMVTKCHGVCAHRLCCFSDDKLQSSCRATVGNAECELYSLCEQLITSNGGEALTALGVKEIESDVTHLCTRKVSEDQNLYNACRDICIQKRSCCFDGPSYSCYEMENEWCDEYKACEVVDLRFPVSVITNPNNGGANNGGGVGSYKTPEQIEKAVYDACYFGTDESKVTQALVEKCHDVCASRFCCFDSYKVGPSCRASVGDQECDLYAECEQLINKSGGVVKNFIELDELEFDTDTPNNLPSGSNNNMTPEQIEKAVYDACYFGTDESKVTQALVEKCHDVCASRFCCFDSYKVGPSCRASVGDQECDLYAECEQLINKSGGVVKNFIELDELEFDTDTPNNLPSGSNNNMTPEQIEKAVYDACYFGTDESKVTQALVEKCHDVCASRFCCFDSYKVGPSCRASVGDQECDLYAECEQLINKSGGVVKNFIELDELEFDTDTTSNGNSASGPGSTVQFPSGQTGINIESEVDSFVTSLENACSESSLKTLDGIQTCHSKCQTHLCCFTTDSKLADQDCSGLLPAACSAYAPCERLVTPPSGNEVVSSTSLSGPELTEKAVYDACYFGEDPSRVTQELVTRCHDVCATRLCCFSDYKLRSSCRATVGEEECNLYSLCDQLVSEGGGEMKDALELEEKEFDIDKLCTGEVASNSNLYSACRESCERRSCCFETEQVYSCYNLEKDWCDEYKACSLIDYNFYDGSYEGNSGNAVEIVSSRDHDLDASIESVCSQDSFKTLEGIEMCFNKCQAHLCCFPEDAAEMKWDCEDDFGDEECNAYANCEQLVAFHNLWKPPPKTLDKFAVKIAVNDACILKSGQQPTEQWVSNCHQKCETRLCCLVDPSIRSSCLDALGEKECSDYSACKVLIGGDSREAEQIEDVCGSVSDANSFSKCETKCKTRQCCFEDGHDFSCYHLEKEWCDEYEACGIVGLKFSSPPAVNTPSQSQSQSFIKQNTITAPTPSITTSGMTNNYGSGSPPTLNSVTNQGDSDSELLILAKACSADQLDIDATECRMLCKGSECCFTPHVENNCSRQSGMQAFCLAHMLCASLFSS